VSGTAPQPPVTGHPKAAFWGLALAALGVVYGDIGTSPLYAMKLCFTGEHGLPVGRIEVLGILSLIVWSLIWVVSVQYLMFILRADNRGEGGIFSLLALVPDRDGTGVRKRTVVLVALAGAALLYGDGVITPSISVLSAVEGLEVATHEAEPFVVPLSVAILLGLFLVQRRGTGRIGRVFGPVMALWFLSIAVLGLRQVLEEPGVLAAFDPRHAVALFQREPTEAFVVLGAVVLCITGAEALYADMGHFGKEPIRRSWYAVVLPSLLLSYFGQGAWLLRHPDQNENPFFALVPSGLLYPMVGLATLATVIASQAMISGAFSLTRQAIQLGFLPRLRILHTSHAMEGQVYIPLVNNVLMLACVLLVLGFRESERLAAAYGVAVTTAFITTAILYAVVARRLWKWPRWRTLLLLAAFLAFPLLYFASSALKILEGGWIPLLLAMGVLVVMDTWKQGRNHLMKRFAERTLTMDRFVEDLKSSKTHRVSGTAVFLSSSPKMAPVALLHHVRHSRVLHQRVLVLSFVTVDAPTVPPAERLTVSDLGQGITRVTANLGFMESPNVIESLKSLTGCGLVIAHDACTYYLSRETLDIRGPSRMPHWRKRLFAFAARNAQTPASFFGLPPSQVVELGAQVDL
jgi:KUP system potassium uptake protein